MCVSTNGSKTNSKRALDQSLKTQSYWADPRNLSDARRVRASTLEADLQRFADVYFHVLVKLKSKSLHLCCFILTFILRRMCEHPISEVLSDGSSCFLQRDPVGFVCMWMCVCARTKIDLEQSAGDWGFSNPAACQGAKDQGWLGLESGSMLWMSRAQGTPVSQICATWGASLYFQTG